MVAKRKYQEDRKGQGDQYRKFHKAPEIQEGLTMAQYVKGSIYFYINLINLNPKIQSDLILPGSYVPQSCQIGKY